MPLGIVEIFGEVGSGLPWLYSGWLLLFSKTYRQRVSNRFRNQALPIISYWLMSLIFCAVEVVLLIYLVTEVSQI